MVNKKNFSSPRLLELKRKRQKILRNKILIFFFLSVILFFGLSFATRFEKINIKNIEVIGNKVLEAEIIKNIVTKEMQNYYYFIVPKTSVLFYPKNQIERVLLNKFKRIKEISVEVKNEQILEIYLSERKAAYTWCGEDILTEEKITTKENCYFMSSDGYIFDKAPYFSGAVYFKFYGVGKIGSLFSPENFNNLISFKDSVTSMGLRPNTFNLKNDGDIELYLASNSSILNSPKILFKKDGNLIKITENLQSAISTDPLKTNLKDKYDTLLYIDLRFGNKIYYKFR
ncbi:MAG: hypothetical protein COU81_00515 [Candidatus Portnoybacteria bacterium CG10_big_fil_rev_8_21_14_0_10_36_7]|uniref:POTRA domain-containing protein n=1 Tax=Candidatus Portnoybacteria bacterium CG10_big_fil_rev_8_21_14_0_10_36_7 TaxID=1974812 RepID=A0A2M8KEY4_9BACT|nr:MAG: hypothetical protein COU81_00515 [Candidatus Portnoybacteria bacterium CG10_big_fil_rev_8_21_14_0_10_36_7]